MIELSVMLDKIRKAGWSVAIHNDYRLNGEFHTFWLFTHENGTYVKGEGKTDIEAIAEAIGRAAIKGMM
jgi:hypothetical protein